MAKYEVFGECILAPTYCKIQISCKNILMQMSLSKISSFVNFNAIPPQCPPL